MINATNMLNDLLTKFIDARRSLTGDDPTSKLSIKQLCEYLVSGKGEATSVGLAREILYQYKKLDDDKKIAFFKVLLNDFGPNVKMLENTLKQWDSTNVISNRKIHFASEPESLELIRRLNRLKGATCQIIDMRNDLLHFITKDPTLKPLDDDFKHLLSSWFNRGFLELRSIKWSTSAEVLERIIKYEAVHEIQDWDDLRRRVIEKDRRLYAYFHPSMNEEPLIFVEVALVNKIPTSIIPILSATRKPIEPLNANTAAFYSISNCQPGLRGISFGNFMIKKAVMELQREFPDIVNFITLSPIPGLHSWAKNETQNPSGLLNSSQLMYLKNLYATNKRPTNKSDQKLLKEITAQYLVNARNSAGNIVDPVARFHLGNGASLKHIHTNASPDQKGIWNAWGLMVNYNYKLKDIEYNHEAFANNNEVIHSSEVHNLIKGS